MSRFDNRFAPLAMAVGWLLIAAASYLAGTRLLAALLVFTGGGHVLLVARQRTPAAWAWVFLALGLLAWVGIAVTALIHTLA